MTQSEFEKSISEEKVVIPLAKYEDLVKSEIILSLVKNAVVSETGHDFISTDTERYIKKILGI